MQLLQSYFAASMLAAYSMPTGGALLAIILFILCGATFVSLLAFGLRKITDRRPRLVFAVVMIIAFAIPSALVTLAIITTHGTELEPVRLSWRYDQTYLIPAFILFAVLVGVVVAYLTRWRYE